MKLNDFAVLYMERHVKLRNATWREYEGRLKNHILPVLGEMELQDITPDDVALLHAKVGAKHPYQANRIKEQLSKMFNLAVLWKKLDWNHQNPTRLVEDFPEYGRMRFATEGEAARIMRELKRLDSVYVRGAILLLLLTGLRKKEVLTLRWENLDRATNEIRCVNIKTKEVIYQPLNTAALEVLAMMPRIAGNPYIIVGKIPGAHRVTITKAWDRVRDRAGVKDIRLHDLRRTVGAWLTQNGVNIQIVKEVMNHKDLKTTLVYARVASKTKREALEIQGQLMSRIISA